MAERRPGKGALAQAQGQEHAAPQRDWSARAPLHAGDPQRYSRFVTIMKRALLLAALALIAAVMAYSLQPREQNRVAMTFEHIGKVANDLAMIKPRLRGTDASGNPFVVTADEAVQAGPTRTARVSPMCRPTSRSRTAPGSRPARNRACSTRDAKTLQALRRDRGLFRQRLRAAHRQRRMSIWPRASCTATIP